MATILINANYRRLWVAQTVSLIGDAVFDTTLMLWVGVVLLAGRPYAPAASSAVLVLTSAVVIALGPIAGVFADRWDQRRTMMRADLARCALIMLLVLLAAFPAVLPLPVTLAVIAVVVVLATAAAQFFNPSRTVLLRDIVPLDQQGRASGYGQSAGALATIIGPPIAAPLLVGVGVPWAILINAVSFAVSYVAIRLVRVPAAAQAPTSAGAPRGSVRADFAAGLRYIRHARLVRATLLSAVVLTLGTGAVNALDLYFVTENLHAVPKWFGLLAGAFGVGAVAGAASGGVLGDRWGHVRVVALGILSAGALIVVYSRLGSVGVAMPVIAGVGFSVGALGAAGSPLLITTVPRELLGRVFAVLGPANRLGAIVSMAVAGALASTALRGLDTTVAGVHLGRIDSIFLTSGLLIIASGVYFAVATRPVRVAEPVAEAA